MVYFWLVLNLLYWKESNKFSIQGKFILHWYLHQSFLRKIIQITIQLQTKLKKCRVPRNFTNIHQFPLFTIPFNHNSFILLSSIQALQTPSHDSKVFFMELTLTILQVLWHRWTIKIWLFSRGNTVI